MKSTVHHKWLNACLQSKLLVPAILLLILWVARYWHNAQFGLYEDDWTIVPRAVTLSIPELLRYVANYIVRLYGHARPLSDSLIYLLSRLGWSIGGLPGAYWIGYSVTALNVLLFYTLVRRTGGPALALLAGLFYCLFSADTTQAFLTHSLGLHPSLTLLFLSLHLYLSAGEAFSYKRIVPYLLVGIILFSYESPYLLFLAAPLLKPWERGRLKELLMHGCILGALLVAVALFRSIVVGEERVTDLGFPQILLTPLLHMIQGPMVSLGTYLYRPVQALQAMNVEVAIASAAALPVLVILLARENYDVLPRNDEKRSFFSHLLEDARTNSDVRRLGRLALAGLAMLLLAYPLTFTVRAYAISGRDTRVHFAAVAGAALLTGCVTLAVLCLARAYGKKWWALLPLAMLLALLVGYGFVVQRDYRLAWQAQQDFWAKVLPLAPDMTDGTVIIVEPDGVLKPLQIGANSWTTPRLLPEIFQFPGSWKRAPRAYLLEPGWQDYLAAGDGLFRLDSSTSFISPSEYLDVPSTQVIWIETTGGQFVRRTQPLEMEGQALTLKQWQDTEQQFPAGLFYPFLFGVGH